MDESVESEIVEVTSLNDVLGDPNEPLEPIDVVWQQGGRLHHMKVEVRRPKDYDAFPIRYMSEKQEAMIPEYDADGNETFPGKDAPDMLLRRECVMEPKFLHNKRDKLSHKLGPDFFSQLHRRLMLTAGIDGDFFLDWAMLQTPKAAVLQSSGFRNTSASSRTKSESDAVETSSQPTTTTSEQSVDASASNSSAMTSGSAPVSPTLASADPQKDGVHPPTQPSVASSTPNPNPSAPAVAPS